jgi:toxin ParE1/3/4
VSYRPFKRSTFFRDVEHAGSYIFARNPVAADRFLKAVESTVQLLVREPFIGHETGFRRALGYRSFRVRGYTRYLIFYRIRNEEVIFARLIYGTRDLPRVIGTGSD